jgi:excisionase family DNA binding protein
MCEKLLLTVTEAGELIGLKRSKMFELIGSGRLRAIKIDGARRIALADVCRFVDQLRQEAEEYSDG